MPTDAEIRSRKDLENWLSDTPVEWAQIVAARCAFRVFPLVLRIAGIGEDRIDQATRDLLILQVFRANFISWAAIKHPEQDLVAFGEGGAAFAAARAAADDEDAAFAAAADAAVAASGTAAKAAAAFAAARAATAFATAAVSDQVLFWQAVSSDLRALKSFGVWGENAVNRLVAMPLWLGQLESGDFHKREEPDEIRKAVAAFLNLVWVRGSAWRLVADWYNAILPESHDRPPRSLFGDRAEITISTQPDSFWSVDDKRSANQVLDEIAEIAGWHVTVPRDDIPIPEYATEFVLRFLAELGEPATNQQIANALRSEGIAIKRNSLNWMLSSFARRHEIIRVARGVYADLSWPDSNAEKSSSSNLPPMPVPPSQGHGPHLGVYDGQIDFAPASNVDEPDTDLGRVERFVPLVKEALEAFVAATPSVSNGGNDPFAREKRMVSRYLDAISRDVRSIDFDLVFGVGTLLMNRLAAEARRSTESDLAPLSDAQLLALQDFQAAHGPLIVSTKAGADAISDAEKMVRNPEEERKFRRTVIEFMESLRQEPGLAKPEVAELLHDAASEMGKGHQEERSFRFGQGAARNTAIVITSVGTMTALPAAGLAFAGPVGAIFCRNIILCSLGGNQEVEII